MAEPALNSHHSRRRWLVIILIAIALYVLLPQLGSFHVSLQLLRQVDWSKFLVAVGLTVATFFAAAATYCLLAFRRLSYSVTVLVEVATNFVNRLLPAGIGALGANYAYLRRSRHSAAQAASVVSVNNILGTIGHLLLVSVLLLVYRGHLPLIHITSSDHRMAWWVLGAVLLVVGAALVYGKRRLRPGVRRVIVQLARYRQRPLRVGAALLSSLSLTFCNVASLYFCLLALHVRLPFVAVLVVFSLAVSVATAAPTPGGLGGFEAGLVAGLVAYRVPHADALAAALLYRLISYWLVFAVGGVAFVICRRQNLFSATAAKP